MPSPLPLTHIPGVSNFGGHFGAYLKYAGFDVLENSSASRKNPLMIVIDVVQEPDYPGTGTGRRRGLRPGENHRSISLWAGVLWEKGHRFPDHRPRGRPDDLRRAINSHYFDPAKQVNGTRGIFRTKTAGRTGLGSVMYAKNVRAVVVIGRLPQRGKSLTGPRIGTGSKRPGARLHHGGEGNTPSRSRCTAKVRPFDQFHESGDLSIPAGQQLPVGVRLPAGQIDGFHLWDTAFCPRRRMDGVLPGPCNLALTKAVP